MEDGLAKKTRSGFIWSAVDSMSGRVIQLVLGIILARLLEPSDFGVIGMLSIFLALSSSILDSGFGMALIQKKDRTQTDYSTVFYFNIVVSVIIYAILFIIAPLIADFYNMPILIPITRVVSIQFLFSALQLVQSARLTIELNFKLLLKIRVLSNILSGFSGVYFAYIGMGVWALVYQQLIACVLQTILLWILSKWTPSFVFSIKSFKSLFSFGSKLLITGLYGPIYENLSSLIIGRLYTPTLLGFYTRAHSLVAIPSGTIQQVISRVTFPVLSQVQDDDKRLLHIYRMLIKQSYFLVFPLLFGICTSSKSIILVLLGEKWLECVNYLKVMSISFAFYQICAFNINLMLVKGRSGLHLKLDICKKIFGIIVLIICANISVLAICYGTILCGIFSWMITGYYSGKLVDLSIWTQIKDITPSFLLAIVMMIFVFACNLLQLNAPITLLIQIIVGMLTYCTLAYIFTRDQLTLLIRMIKK